MRIFAYRALIISLIVLGLGFALSQKGPSLSIQGRSLPSFFKAAPEYTLLFVGDIMLDRDVEKSIRQNGGGDFRYPFLQIADLLSSADLTFGNLEGNISDKGANQGSIYSFRMDPGAVEGLSYAGFDVLSLANNHSLDWGRTALTDTINRLEAVGISAIGAGRTETEANGALIKTLPDNTRIAFLAYTNLYPRSFQATGDTPGISRFDAELVKAAIQELKVNNRADIVVISIHWGEEYETTSNQYQRDLAHSFVDSGADLIIGHHPHVVQEVEAYDSPFLKGGAPQGRGISQDDKHIGYIAYSLGNFVFDQNFSNETMQGLILEAKIQDKKVISIKEIPTQLTPQFQVRYNKGI